MSLFHSPEFVALNGLTLIERPWTGSARLLLGPERGTYGGFCEAPDVRLMDSLIAEIPYTATGIHTIKLAPSSHDPNLFSLSVNALSRAGFAIGCADLNYDLVPGNLSFIEIINRAQRKKLAKCAREGFRSGPLDQAEWPAAYALLKENRLRAGHELSLPWTAICDLETALPGTYRFFATWDGERMIAAAICVLVEPDILYVYAWGDAEKTTFAPTVQLAQAIYEEACFMSCRLLDAGRSTLDGVPNDGLIAFKESLGFRPSLKLTMVRR